MRTLKIQSNLLLPFYKALRIGSFLTQDVGLILDLVCKSCVRTVFATERTPLRSQKRQMKIFFFLSFVPSILPPSHSIPSHSISRQCPKLIAGVKHQQDTWVLFNNCYLTLSSGSVPFHSSVHSCFLHLSAVPSPAAVPQLGQKLHFQLSTNQLCLSRAVLHKVYLQLRQLVCVYNFYPM